MLLLKTIKMISRTFPLVLPAELVLVRALLEISLHPPSRRSHEVQVESFPEVERDKEGVRIRDPGSVRSSLESGNAS
jgi:hypothetical protein